MDNRGAVTPRQDWVRATAIASLKDVEATDGPEAAWATARSWEAPDAATVDRWVDYTRGQTVTGLGGQRARRRPEGVPSGLRRRDIELGLMAASQTFTGEET